MSAFLLQVGTGQRVLDVPGTELVGGGGVRVGWDFGVVAPFVGGNLTHGAIDAPDEELEIPGTLWSATLGVRFDAAPEDRPLHPFVAAGAVVGRGGGRIDFEQGREVYEVVANVGPGGFLGAGADAALLPSLALGLEVGGVLAPSQFSYSESFRGERDDEISFGATGIWSYVDLHLVFRPGGGR